MNMLAVRAEMATWPTGGIIHPLISSAPEDRCVVDTSIDEIAERLGDKAVHMAEIYARSVRDFLLTM